MRNIDYVKNTLLRMWNLLLVFCCLTLLSSCSSSSDEDKEEGDDVVEASVVLNVNVNVRHQKVIGFGGTDAAVMGQVALTNEDVDQLFGSSNITTNYQLGCNIMRVCISQRESEWSNEVAAIRRAKSEHAAKIIACSWSPCEEWKGRKNNVDDMEDSEDGPIVYLKKEHYGDYALFIKRYLDYMEAAGATIDYVSVQNELDLGKEGDFEGSCHWTPEGMYDFVRNHLAKISSRVKFVGIEGSFFGEETRNYANLILNDPVTANFVDAVAFHLYGKDEGEERVGSYPLAAQKDKEVWMTEYLMNDAWTKPEDVGDLEGVRPKSDAVILQETMEFAKLVNECMLSDFNAFVWWGMKCYHSFIGDGYAATKLGEVQKRGYIISHYAKYVTGRTRVDITSKGTNELSTSAYINDSGNEIILMVVNSKDKSYPDVDLVLPFKAGRVKTITTSQSLNVHTDEYALNDISYLTSIVPNSVTTFIFTR